MGLQAVNFKLVPVQFQLMVVNLCTILGGCCARPRRRRRFDRG